MSDQVIAGRFEIIRPAGSGGMGVVYCARDRERASLVALKVLEEEKNAERFLREAHVLAELDEPTIVRYVAHGRTDDNELYLAMEWLEGNDLEQRLTAQGRSLSVGETLTLAKRVAMALASAHARGVVHRDIKPSNIFLPGDDVANAKVLDFGIARWRTDAAGQLRTRTGVVIGTPAYMAPEQARGARDVDARADVFALGCIVYECLTGTPAFAGDSLMAILARILFEPSPQLLVAVPNAPPALDALVTRMLSKDPSMRFENGAAALAALESLHLDDDVELGAAAVSNRLGTSELRNVVLLLVHWSKKISSVTLEEGEESEAALVMKVLEEHGARVESLANGSIAALFESSGEISDTAAIAARCALSLRTHTSAALALTVGQVEVGARRTLTAIDEAARLLTTDAAQRAVAIDDVTTGFLEARFEIHSGELGAPRHVAGARTLLGKPTPCVGRDRELAILSGFIDEAIDESRARAVLVTAVAGVGKTRVALEIVRRVREEDRATIWIAQADPMRSGAPLGVLVPLVRKIAGVGEGERDADQRARIAAHVAEHVASRPDAARIAAFLAELVGVAEHDVLLPEVVAARRDPKMLASQLARAFSQWLAAIATRTPIVIIVEDLHWADAPSVDFLDAALRELRDKPLAVFAFGRPEVEESFPRLWAASDAQHIRLGTLGRKASEVLARHVLGKKVADSTLSRIFEVSGGNAFYLEELIRAVADNASPDTLPETVLAMTTARLDRLPLEARRVLRAASIFGEVFWRNAVSALVGGVEVDAQLDELVRREAIMVREETRFAGQQEYAFRHALVRDAAYAMLTEEDRLLGHRLAGEWLATSGEDRCAVIAEHFELGAENAQACIWYVRAAGQANMAADFRNAIAQADRAIKLGARGEELIEAKSQKGKAFVALALWADAKATYQDILIAMAEANADPIRVARMHLALAKVTFFLFELDDTDHHSARALELIRSADTDSVEPELEADAIASNAIVQQARGNLHVAIKGLEQASERAQGRYFASESILLLSSFWAGRIDETIARARRFNEAARNLADVSSLMLGLPQLGLTLVGAGRYTEAEEVFEEAVRLGEAHGSNLLPRAIAVSVSLPLELDLFAETETRAARALELARIASFSPTIVSAQLDMLFVRVRRGDEANADVDALISTLDGLIDESNGGWHGWLFATRFAIARAELARRRKQPAEARAFADAALSRARRVGRTKHIALALALKGEGAEAYALAEKTGDPALLLRVARFTNAPTAELEARLQALMPAKFR